MIYNENGENLICVDNQCMLMEAFISDKYNEKLNELDNLIRNLDNVLTEEDCKRINDAVPHKKYLKGIEICAKIVKILKVIVLATGGSSIILAIFKKSTLAVISFVGLLVAGIGWLITKGIQAIFKDKDKKVYIKNLKIILDTLNDLKRMCNDDEHKQTIQNQINQISEYIEILDSIEDQVNKDKDEIEKWIARYQLEKIYDKEFPTLDTWVTVSAENNKYDRKLVTQRSNGTIGIITNIIENNTNKIIAECIIYGYPVKNNKKVTFSYVHSAIITDMIPYNKSVPVKMLAAPNKAKVTFIFNDNYQIKPEELFVVRH